MTVGGWILLCSAWGIVFALMGFCYYKTMSLPSMDETRAAMETELEEELRSGGSQQ